MMPANASNSKQSWGSNQERGLGYCNWKESHCKNNSFSSTPIVFLKAIAPLDEKGLLQCT